MKQRLLTLILAIAALAGVAQMSNVAVKTNLLYDATASPNLGVEWGFAPKWSADISGNFNDWAIKDHLWKHWFVQPEIRYWFCERFSGHFLAAHAIAGEYNWGNWGSHTFNFLGNDFDELQTRRHQGWGAGLGIGYGYTHMLSRHWSIEGEIALGWIYTRYDVYPCASCGRKIRENAVHNYVGPTKAAINIIYVF